MKDLIINNWDKIIFILPFIFWIYEFFKNKKAEIEIEKLKSKLELEKDKNMLNDKKFRQAYEDFICLLFDMLHQKKTNKKIDVESWIVEFMKKTLLFAWPETLKTFWLYRKEAGSWNEKDIMIYTENLIFAMRKDLWVSNEKLEQYDILQTFIIWDIKKAIEK